MTNCKDVFFSILDGDNLDLPRKELLCAATLEYSEFLIVSGSRSLLADLTQFIYAAVQIRPRCLLVPTSTVLATAEHFLVHVYLPDDADRRFIKFDLDTGAYRRSPAAQYGFHHESREHDPLCSRHSASTPDC